ncbi:hypothetical protein [Plebeiibacterium marinum]|uniref:Uncharacterized protein n=1 Tax=Plebeiibacterium marinum TaxID=2992111 RepID=A0AAE3MHG7_9BACT|nr:hypothetical protein [Plebeiobacterium marinum]MCW3807571.1 hypothetical protein [Plebeiobacterium marinum]
MSFNVEWRGANIIVKFSGLVSYQEINEADGIIYGNKHFDQMQYQVFDFSGIDGFNVNELEMKMIGTLDKASSHWNNSVKVAVITDDPKIVELTRVYEGVMDDSDWETKIFKSMEDALKWCT